MDDEPSDVIETWTAPTIVVVDDDDDVRELLTRSLERDGLRALAASTGEAALDHARHARVDVMLVDLHLGIESGIDLAARLRADPSTSSIALVAISGMIEPEWTLVRDFDLYLRKPIRVAGLSDLCRSLARVARRARGLRADSTPPQGSTARRR